MSLTTEKIDLSSTNNLVVDDMPLTKSLMHIKKNKGHKIESCGTASTGVHAEVWSFITTLWSLLFRKL